ncbi:MAG: hypothetical protein H7338_18750 [Candidatus Sericytochromatia bacterium]|nr:hypothetical protein [Candidatus Sericytochromatia bacterium]
MRHSPMLLVLAASAVTLTLAAPALAHETGKPATCNGHDCAADKECNTVGKCGPNHDKCGAGCAKMGAKSPAGAACDPKAKGHEQCAKDGMTCCAKPDAACCAKPDTHGQVERRVEIHEIRTGDSDRTLHSGWRHGAMGRESHFGVNYQANAPTGNGYMMVSMEHLFGKPTHGMFWNPKMGMGATLGQDVADQTVTRNLGYMGWIAQNTFRFGRMRVTAGVLLGGGMNVGITQTVDFQNFNGFFVADPRLTLGYQVTPRFAIEATGNYLLTTRPAAVGGPGAGLKLSYGF